MVHFYQTVLFIHPDIAHDRSQEFHWKFNQPVAAKMIQLQNPILRFLKTTKGNFSGEDFAIGSFLQPLVNEILCSDHALLES